MNPLRKPDYGATLFFRTMSLIVTLLMIVAFWMSCGDSEEFNLFQPFSEPAHEKEAKAKVESARLSLDEKQYDKAASLLEPMILNEEENTNEARLLYAAAILGQVDLNIWEIIKNFLDTQTSNSSSKSGLDGFLESVTGNILGTGEEKTVKLATLTQAVSLLRQAPNPNDKSIVNTACLLSGILAVPTFTDAKEAMTSTLTALSSIRSSASSDGSNCPNIGQLDLALTNAALASNRFSLVMEIAGGCSFLNIGGASSDLNSIEKQLSSLITNADKGCDSLPTCPSNLPDCQSYFPKCVQDILKVGTGQAKAGDKSLASCELTLHCAVGSSCFQ